MGRLSGHVTCKRDFRFSRDENKWVPTGYVVQCVYGDFIRTLPSLTQAMASKADHEAACKVQGRLFA
jgi:hypothetical protein